MARRPPVVLLPGAFGQELLYWNVWQRRLERDGYRVYAASFPKFTFSDLKLCAKFLQEKIELVLEAEGADRVALVGHSMGGIVARWHLKYQDGGKTASSLACLATPHHGTWTAATAPVLTGTRQIVPGSPFLVELNDERVSHGGVPILNVWTRWDGVVVPSQSAFLDVPGVVNREVPYVGHWGLLVSRRAYRWIKDGLESPVALPG